MHRDLSEITQGEGMGNHPVEGETHQGNLEMIEDEMIEVHPFNCNHSRSLRT
jgi:hypothetical protein